MLLIGAGLFFYALLIYRIGLSRRLYGRWTWTFQAQSQLEAQARHSLWLGYGFLHLFIGLYCWAPVQVQQIFSVFLPWQAYPLRMSAALGMMCCAGLWFWLSWRMGSAWHIGIYPQVTVVDQRVVGFGRGVMAHPIYVVLTLMTLLAAVSLPLWLLIPVVFLCSRGWYLQARAEDEFWQALQP